MAGGFRQARGLQAVDGLTTSAAFDEAAERYVAGDISARELSDIVDDYYDQKVERGVNRYSQEADLVSARICDALDSNGFTFSPATLRAIHGRLFRGLMEEPFYELTSLIFSAIFALLFIILYAVNLKYMK